MPISYRQYPFTGLVCALLLTTAPLCAWAQNVPSVADPSRLAPQNDTLKPQIEEVKPPRDESARAAVVLDDELAKKKYTMLDLVVEDQTVGLKRMRAGEVAACICASERPVAGARSVLLGAMRYRALASPAFIARHFPEGVRADLLSKTPALVFGPDDFLQHRYLSSVGVDGGFEHHLCPSSEGFIRLTEAGLGWGLVPELQVREQLERGVLVELLPDKPIDVPLYWHHWRNGGQLLGLLTDQLVRSSKQWLVPLD